MKRKAHAYADLCPMMTAAESEAMAEERAAAEVQAAASQLGRIVTHTFKGDANGQPPVQGRKGSRSGPKG